MPIDTGLGHELIQGWLPAFLNAAMLSPTHPLREKAFAEAEAAVYEAYKDLDIIAPEDDGTHRKVSAAHLRDCAADVIEMLNAFAYLAVEADRDGERLCELGWWAA